MLVKEWDSLRNTLNKTQFPTIYVSLERYNRMYKQYYGPYDKKDKEYN